jgi:hypothetical protein
LVATAILFAVQHGDEHVLVADPPRAIQLGAEVESILRTGRGSTGESPAATGIVTGIRS